MGEGQRPQTAGVWVGSRETKERSPRQNGQWGETQGGIETAVTGSNPVNPFGVTVP